MKIKKLIILLLCCFSFSHSFSQDTLRVAVYNLLRYGANGINCSPTGVTARNTWFSAIMNGIKPDIFGCNEIGTSALPSTNILQNILQPINPNYEKTTFTNNSGADLTNMLFYNSQKLGLHKEEVINHPLRDINTYTLYYKDQNLATTQDTIFFTVILVHYSAGNASQQVTQGQAIMNYLDGLNAPGNYIVMGDLNVASSNATSYQTLVGHSNPDTKMNDPVNRPGSWGSNSSFRDLYTQSTRSSGLADCGSGGGVDDRFDHILISDQIKNNTDRASYVGGSYWAYGNDGLNRNGQSINNPTNTAVSTLIAGSLVQMSDHLPVIMDVAIEGSPVAVRPPAVGIPGLEMVTNPNPFQDALNIRLNNSRLNDEKITVRIVDQVGRTLINRQILASVGGSEFQFKTETLPSGIYLIYIYNDQGQQMAKRLVKL